jgi:hypothetical protein
MDLAPDHALFISDLQKHQQNILFSKFFFVIFAESHFFKKQYKKFLDLTCYVKRYIYTVHVQGTLYRK